MIQLLKFGFTLSSSVMGGLFYLLIGGTWFPCDGSTGYSYLLMVSNEESSKSRKSWRSLPFSAFLVLRRLRLAYSIHFGLFIMNQNKTLIDW